MILSVELTDTRSSRAGAGIGEVLRYFRLYRHRRRYADTQAGHLPIGSGVVEAGCKTVVTQRPKRSRV